ncbi:MAG: hypothetical protein ACJ700_00515 [Nitrososphaera sp.]
MPDNCLKQAQSNTVILTQREMDRVGFEPTTSAQKKQLLDYKYYIKKWGFSLIDKVEVAIAYKV